MADKNNNSLAKKLIDDLLVNELSAGSSPPKKKEPPKQQTTPIEADDKTIPLQTPQEDRTTPLSAVPGTRSEIRATDPTVLRRDRWPEAEDRVRAGVGRFATLRSGALTSADATLAQAENLRIAQSRILELETEIERLRSNNEQLAAAGETLRVRADENLALVESITARYQNLESVAEDERVMAQKNIQSKDKELTILRGKIDEMEMRLSTNIQKIRVRERELENRLELVKMESQALLRTKDEMILDLKRQIDQLNLELDNYRNKGQELNKKIHDKQELLRRTVKALRLALSMLEGDDK